MTSLIPGNAQTILPNGQTVQPTSYATPQAGTRVTPRTAKGSGVYGQPGAVAAPINAPIRDYVVRLVNEGPRDFRMRYLTVEYLVMAGDELIVPWEVMVAFLGSPEVQNLGPRRMDRKNVFEKLRVKYGAYYDDDVWEANKPRLAAYRVTGERLTTVVDDPDGMAITPSTISQQTAMAQHSQIELMQRQMDAMTEMISQLTGQSRSPGYQEPTSDGTVPFSTEGLDPSQMADQMAPEAPDGPLAPEAPTMPIGGPIEPVTLPPYDTSQQAPAPVSPLGVQVMMPPPPVPGMSPSMPPPDTARVGDGGGATADSPRSPVQIG